jgi:hypothetical protein
MTPTQRAHPSKVRNAPSYSLLGLVPVRQSEERDRVVPQSGRIALAALGRRDDESGKLIARRFRIRADSRGPIYSPPCVFKGRRKEPDGLRVKGTVRRQTRLYRHSQPIGWWYLIAKPATCRIQNRPLAWKPASIKRPN